MTRVLALDCSTHVGWAVSEGPAGPVRFDTWQMPTLYAHHYGRSFVAFEAWLVDMVTVHAPDVVAFEAPLVFMDEHSSADILRMLTGMATIVELVATRVGKRCMEVAVPTAKHRLAGNGHATKRQMISAAVKLGHLVEDDHQADAIAVILVAYDHMEARRLDHLPGPLWERVP